MPGEYSLTLALDSPGFAKECYINYYYQNNTMGISSRDMGAIVQAYEEKIPSWTHYAELDINDYEIEDEDRQEGKKQARKDSGYNNTTGQKAGQIANTTGTCLGTAGEAATNYFAEEALQTVGKAVFKNAIQGFAKKAGEKAVKKATEEAIKEAGKKAIKKAAEDAAKQSFIKAGDKVIESTVTEEGKKALENATEEVIKEKGKAAIEQQAKQEAEKKAGENIGIIVSCTFDGLNALKYRLTNPNKDQMEAVNTYANNLPTKQEETATEQDNLEDLNDALVSATDDANSVCDDANTYMASDMTDYGLNQRTIEYTEAAITSGYQLSEKDIESYQEAVETMTNLSDDVDYLSEEAQSMIEESYTDMEGAQTEFDSGAEVVGNIDGYVAETENVAQSTQIMSNIEGTMQTVNAGMASYHAYKAAAAASATGWCGLGVAFGIAAGVAGAAVVSDGFAAKEQFDYADKCGDTIDACDATKDLNNGTLDVLNTNYEDYQGLLDDVGSLELEVPENMEVPEEISPEELKGGEQDAEATQNSTTGGTGNANTTSLTGADTTNPSKNNNNQSEGNVKPASPTGVDNTAPAKNNNNPNSGNIETTAPAKTNGQKNIFATQNDNSNQAKKKPQIQ